eukprot:Hpha_TRINITY_DN16485_c1_g5::TRINITY_DN16485_c1_g5_i1::g.160419::m.160419
MARTYDFPSHPVTRPVYPVSVSHSLYQGNPFAGGPVLPGVSSSVLATRGGREWCVSSPAGGLLSPKADGCHSRPASTERAVLHSLWIDRVAQPLARENLSNEESAARTAFAGALADVVEAAAAVRREEEEGRMR